MTWPCPCGTVQAPAQAAEARGGAKPTPPPNLLKNSNALASNVFPDDLKAIPTCVSCIDLLSISISTLRQVGVPQRLLCISGASRIEGPALSSPRLRNAAAAAGRRSAARGMGGRAGLVGYERAVAEMEARAEAIAAGEAAERVWLVEHPPLYTAGTSARSGDLIDARFPVFKTGRGGQYTYHGPGQRVAYVMLDLKRRRPDLRAYVGVAGGVADRHAGDVRRPRRDARRARRRLGGAPRQAAAGAPRTRSPPSACACGAGRRSTASRSMSRRTSRISTGIVPCGISEPRSRRHQPARSRPGDDDGGGRRRVAPRFRAPLRRRRRAK